MIDPIDTVLYDIAKAIVDTITEKRSNLGRGDVFADEVIEDVQDVLMKRLSAAGFIRVEQIDSTRTLEQEVVMVEIIDPVTGERRLGSYVG